MCRACVLALASVYSSSLRDPRDSHVEITSEAANATLAPRRLAWPGPQNVGSRRPTRVRAWGLVQLARAESECGSLGPSSPRALFVTHTPAKT